MGNKSNLGARIIGAIIFVVVIFGLIWLREISTLPFDCFAALCGIIGSFELLKMLKDDSHTSRIFLIIFGVASVPANIWHGEVGVLVVVLVLFAARAIVAIFGNHDILKVLSSFTFAIIYPAWIFTLLMEMNHWGQIGTVALLLVFMIGPFCDVGAYLFGVTIGGKKLCPAISPNKTIAGAVGGVLGGLLGGITVYFIAINLLSAVIEASTAMIVCFLLLGLVGAVLTEIGDLVESAIKRSAGVKDAGNILPGHGGILDRFDGVILVVLLVYVVFTIFIIV